MPQESAQADYMKSFMGKAAAVDTDGFIDDLQWRPKVIAKTSDYTVTVNESGAIFTTEGATAAVEFTLPSAGSGPWVFFFYNAEDVEMGVAAETADTLVTFNNAAADKVQFTTASEHIGGAFMCFSAGGSVVYAAAMTYDATDQAVTIVDA